MALFSTTDGGHGRVEALSFAAARRRVIMTSAAALVGAAALGVVFAVSQNSPRVPVGGFVYLLAVPLLVALVHAVFSLALEASWPRVRGAARRARLRRRGLGEIVERSLVVVHGAAIVVFVLIASLGAVLSRDGRTLGWGWTERSGTFLGVVVNTTFPGWRVTLPLTLVLVTLLAATWASLFLVLQRPDVVTAERDRDLALRRVPAGRVLRLTTGALLVTDGGLTALAGAAVSVAFRDEWIGDVGTGIAIAGLVVAGSALLLTLPLARRHGRSASPGAGSEA